MKHVHKPQNRGLHLQQKNKHVKKDNGATGNAMKQNQQFLINVRILITGNVMNEPMTFIYCRRRNIKVYQQIKRYLKSKSAFFLRSRVHQNACKVVIMRVERRYSVTVHEGFTRKEHQEDVSCLFFFNQKWKGNL
jgi:hypothetical protein